MTGELHAGFDAILAGRFAAAFAIVLRDELQLTNEYPSVAVAGDGRAVTQGHFAEVVEKLRWGGCHVVDLGTVPCPAMPWAIEELDADGGLFLGNPQGDPYQAGIRFYRRHGQPLTGLAALSPLCHWVDTDPDRPVRTWGKASRAEAQRWYESRLADSFHGLRPLRFQLHTTCRPTGRCAVRLLQGTACKMVLRDSGTALPPERLSDSVGHFAAAIEDDGQRCRLWDERGESVPFERLFLLLAQSVCGSEPSGRTVVVEERLPDTVAEVMQRSGLTVRRCGPLPSDIHTAMVDSGAALGGDGAGRIWYGEAGGRAIADALGTLTLVLGKLSEGDRPLSEVLDAEVPGH